MTKAKEITTAELQLMMIDKNTVIVDIRPVDAYNGWAIKNEKRGGHIMGARSLPLKWTQYMDWIEVVQSKGISTKNQIVIYGYTSEDANEVVRFFDNANFKNISVYNHFIDQWSVNERLPMEHLARYKNLVSAEWVQELISGGKPAEYDNNKYVVVHSHYRNREAYLNGHIPGAIDMDTLALEAAETWNRRPPKELKEALEAHGIDKDTTVIMYGKFMTPNNDDEFPGSAAGHIGAIRNTMIMLYAGVKDVRVLNGGFQSWKDAGFAIETADIAKMSITDFGASIPVHPEIIVDVPEAKIMIQSPDADIVCVRSWPEFIGKVSGYNYIEKKGRIPGAVFGNCGTDAYHMENYRNVDHTIREAQEVAATWKSVDIVPDKHLAFYCGTGWRGSEAFFNAWLMGWPRVSVFDGGWFEWSNDPENPFETGVPADLN